MGIYWIMTLEPPPTYFDLGEIKTQAFYDEELKALMGVLMGSSL